MCIDPNLGDFKRTARVPGFSETLSRVKNHSVRVTIPGVLIHKYG